MEVMGVLSYTVMGCLGDYVSKMFIALQHREGSEISTPYELTR